jgi:putative flippase GtrA
MHYTVGHLLDTHLLRRDNTSTMRRAKRIDSFRITRFGLAGLINTVVNFTVLNISFYWLHQNKFVSIVIATSCAIAVSFILNRNFVFLDKTQPAKKLTRFILVSVIGVFLIQNAVYALCVLLLQDRTAAISSTIRDVTGYQVDRDFIDVNLSNLIASLAVMVWNYNGYSLFVFNSKRRSSGGIESISEETA